MQVKRSVSSFVAAAGVALAAFAMAGSARAQEVFWSLGVSSPGVQLGLSNVLPMVVRPMYQPVYQPVYQPMTMSMYEPVYRAPPPVYVAPQPVVYMPSAPVYVGQAQYVRPDGRYRGHGRGWKHDKQRREGEHSGHERGDRRD